MSDLGPIDDGSFTAGFDYDWDGDLDLLVSTSQGSMVWLNDGLGRFSPLVIDRVAAPIHPAPRLHSATVSPPTPFDRGDVAIVSQQGGTGGRDAVDRIRSASTASARQFLNTSVSSRAPPLI